LIGTRVAETILASGQARPTTGRTYGCKRSGQTSKSSSATGAVHIWVPARASLGRDDSGETRFRIPAALIRSSRANRGPSKSRGRRECQVFGRTHGLACKTRKHTSLFTTGEAETSALPARWLTTYSCALPGVHDLVSHRRLPIVSTNLAPAQGCQDHTTLPSALTSHALRRCQHPPHFIARSWRSRSAPLLRWNAHDCPI
jgi:hypothetical protein